MDWSLCCVLPNRYNVGHVAIGIGDLGLAYQVTNAYDGKVEYGDPLLECTLVRVFQLFSAAHQISA